MATTTEDAASTADPEHVTDGGHPLSRRAPRLAGVRQVPPGGSLGLGAAECAVCIPVFGAPDMFAESLRRVLAFTPPSVMVVVADDGTPGPDIQEIIEALRGPGRLRHEVVYVRRDRNGGFVTTMNLMFEAARPADVVIVNSDCHVTAEWFDRLSAAAYSDTTIATACPLTNNGTIVSVPYRNRPQPQLPRGWDADSAASAIRAGSLGLRPRIPVGIGHCLYVKRAALDLAGTFDTTFSPGYGEEVDFSLRCAQLGMSHVVADDVFVLHHGGESFAADPRRAQIQAEHEQILEQRYPLYHPLVKDEVERRADTPLARSIGAARRALLGLSVTIDATCLGNYLTGTQVQTLELVAALSRQHMGHLRVLVQPSIGETARRRLAALDEVEIADLHAVDWSRPPSDVAHRPFQLTSLQDLAVLRRLGERVVLTQQDLIAYRNLSYHDSYASWQRYRNATRVGLGIADLIFFCSEHAALDAMADGLVDETHARVVYNGTDHGAGAAAPEAPEWEASLQGRAFILCLGTDFHHKNRVFALEVLAELQRRHRWGGLLVLAGQHVAEGSSRAEEARFLARHPDAAAATVTAGGATDPEKRWLYQHASLVLYPTTYEGFGLIPFEAAAEGVATVFAAQASLGEVLSPHLSRIVAWDAAATSDRVAELLGDATARQALIDGVARAGQSFTWDGVAERAVAAYREVAAAAPRTPADVDGMAMPMSVLADQLVGDHGMLPDDVQQALWAIARRPALARGFYAAVRGVHRVGFWAAQAGRQRRTRDRG